MTFDGRSYDILALGTRPDSPSGAEVSLLFSESDAGAICTGSQKLAQRWALEFLTIRGSMGFHLVERGSDFLRWLREGLLRTEADVQAYFNFAASQVKATLLHDVTDTTPDDEIIETASLNEITLFLTGLVLSVTIVTRAGDDRAIILPIAVTPAEFQS